MQIVPMDRLAVDRNMSVVRECLLPIEKNSRGTITLEEVIRQFEAKECQFWAVLGDEHPGVIHGIIVTKILEYPSGRRVFLMAHGGGIISNEEVPMEVIGLYEKIARDRKCHAIQIKGRKGWLKKFPHFTEVSRCIEKEL